MAGVLNVGGSGGLSPERILDGFGVDPLQASRVSDLELFLLEFDGLDDVDSLGRSLVVTGDFVVHLIDGSLHANVSVLFEHIVDSSVRTVLQENAEVLGDGFGLVVDFLNLENFAVAALQLVVALVELPEARSSDGFVGGDNLDNDDGGIRVLVSGKSSAEDEELSAAVASSVNDGSGLGFHK